MFSESQYLETEVCSVLEHLSSTHKGLCFILNSEITCEGTNTPVSLGSLRNHSTQSRNSLLSCSLL